MYLFGVVIKRFARYKLLILDDFGVSPISVDDATNLFEIIETRNQLSSTIITSQLPVKDWYVICKIILLQMQYLIE